MSLLISPKLNNSLMNKAKTDSMDPNSSSFTIMDTLENNQSLEYQTLIQYSSNQAGEQTENYLITNQNNITKFPEDPHLFVQEFIDINSTSSSFDSIRSKTYNYSIANTSNVPFNTSFNFPSVLRGEWQHNFPVSTTTFQINTQQESFLFAQQKIVNLTYLKNEMMELNGNSIAVSKFYHNSTYTVAVACG